MSIDYANNLKSTLENIIKEMSSNTSLFVKNPGKDFTRDRKLSFDKLLHLLLGMRGNSINKKLYDYFKNDDLMTSSAFVQQRDKLLPNALEYLLNEFNNKTQELFDKETYKGYSLYAIDGSDINIATNPNSDSYCDFYKDGRKGYNQLHANCLYDLLNKTYRDCLVQVKPKQYEARAAIDMINRQQFKNKSIIICDRGYSSYNLFEHCKRKDNVDFLIRVPNNLFKEIKSMPMEEWDIIHKIELRTTQTNDDKKAYESGKAKWINGPSTKGKSKKTIAWDFESPCDVEFRIVRFKISDDTYETIATSLNRFEFPISVIKELYHLRWGIETSFRELKYAIGLTNFHAKKEDYILQEIFVRLVMYNFCERITKQLVIKQDANRKHTY